MLTSYGIIAVLVILVVTLLAIALLAWFFISSSRSKPPQAKPDPRADAKAQSIVQRFVSSDLKKRAFIIRQNEDRFKVVFEHYSTKVISRDGEVAGWQTMPEKPVTDSLSSAVEIAKSWVHADD